MSKIMIVPGDKESINNLLSQDIGGLILGLEDLSIYDVNFTLEEIKKIASITGKDIVVAINKMIHNSDIPLVRSAIKFLENTSVKKILFYDLGVYQIMKEEKSSKESIISLEHLNTSINSNNFYYQDGIKNSFISSDITYKEVLDIKNNTKMNIYYTIYGYLPIFYSRRKLITNYFTYINSEKEEEKYFLQNNNLKYLVKENNFGTIIYSPKINLIDKINKLTEIDYLVIDLSYEKECNLDTIIKNNNEEPPYLGFFDTKTVYKMKDIKGGSL